MCLYGTKGRTKGKKGLSNDLSQREDLMKVGRDFYRSHMIELLKMILPEESDLSFCEKTETRFKWLHDFIC